MKRIALWKMILLYVATLGIYGIVWLAKRRNELVATTNEKIPHIAWIIVPPILTIVLMVPVILLTVAISSNDYEKMTLLALGMLTLFVIVVFSISIWWFWKFAAGAEKAINKRVPIGWAIAHLIFGGVTILFIWQFYFNRIHRYHTTPPPKQGPTKRFIVLSVVALLLLTLADAASFAYNAKDFSNFINESNQQSQQIEKLDEETNSLQAKYDECTRQLDIAFPEVTSDNEIAYNKAYDTCDSIYRKLDRLIREYNSAVNGSISI